MGGQLSQNYTNIQQIFTLDVWDVHTAEHKTTNEKVSLWMINQERLNNIYKNKTDQNTFLDLTLQSIQSIRRLRHPRVLKILEVYDKKPDIAFASEPVMQTLASPSINLHPMDVAYISLQVAEVLGFLNQDARLAHLGLCPSAVLLNDQYAVKLIHFHFSVPVNSQGQCQPPPILLETNVFSDIQYKPPEILAKKNITAAADIFIFGLFMYQAFTGKRLYNSSNPNEICGSIPTVVRNIFGVPADFKDLLQSCLSLDPASRPTFTQIQQHQAFQSMQLKSLRYIDMILTKAPADKFKFYKGLSAKISDFSPSLTRIKILPTILSECKADVRFAPVLLGAIFQISKDFTTEEFMRDIWSKISFLTTITEPPEVSIAFFQNMKLILEKVDEKNHKDYVYPIFFAALQSGESKLHKEVLQRIPIITAEMNENSIRSLVLPRMLDLATTSNDSSIIGSSIQCISKCLGKVDNDSFASEFLPKIASIWGRSKSALVGSAIVDVIENLKAANDILLSKAIPIASEICGTHQLDSAAKVRLCDWMISVITRFRDQKEAAPSFNPNSIEIKSNVLQSTHDIDPDNPFAEPVKPAVISPTSSAASKPAPSTSAIMDFLPPSKPANTQNLRSAMDDFISRPTPAPSSSSTRDTFYGSNTFNMNSNSSQDIFGGPSQRSSQDFLGSRPQQDFIGGGGMSSRLAPQTDFLGSQMKQPQSDFLGSSARQEFGNYGNNAFNQNYGSSSSSFGMSQSQQNYGSSYGQGSSSASSVFRNNTQSGSGDFMDLSRPTQNQYNHQQSNQGGGDLLNLF